MSDWTTLDKLPPGTLFETEKGERFCKARQRATRDRWLAVSLAGDQDWAFAADARVRPLPAPGEAPSPLSEADRAEARAELAKLLGLLHPSAVGVDDDGDGDTTIIVQAKRSLGREKLRRLLWLLSLPPQLLSFVCAAAQTPTDTDLLAVFSDWLKDHVAEEAGERAVPLTLYLVERTDTPSWEDWIGCVVAAANPEEASRVHPNGYQVMGEDWHQSLRVTPVGRAGSGVKRNAVLLASNTGA